MRKAENSIDSELRPGYDLKSLRVRKVGPKRKTFGSLFVRLDPDVAELFPRF